MVLATAGWIGVCGCATDDAKGLADKAAAPVQQAPAGGQPEPQRTLPGGRPIPADAPFGAYTPNPGMGAPPGSVSPAQWR